MSESELSYSTCLESHCNCIVCGRRNPIGLGLAFEVGADGVVTSRFRGNKLFQGYDGVLHGGIISALLDASMTHCLFHAGVQAVTGSLDVRFVETVPCDAVLTIRAHLAEARPPLFKLKSELLFGRRLMAHAEARFMQVRTRVS